MYDTGKVLTGLIVFLLVVSAPFWYNLAIGTPAPMPALEKATPGTQCVRDSAYMVVHHMDLLDEWRDQVVRDRDRFETGADGVCCERSLSKTCLGCHKNKDKFCDCCHTYLGVEPYCWDCHVDPEAPRQ